MHGLAGIVLLGLPLHACGVGDRGEGVRHGAGAWAPWMDIGKKAVKVRHYYARMVVPLTWDVECVIGEYETGSAWPTFSIVRPAVANTRVDFSPYGQSVFADAIDAVQAVDLTSDALITEVDVSKMRVFLSDVMSDQKTDGKGKRIPIPVGKGDCTVFRKVMSTEDMVQEFAPALRTSPQSEAFRIALQMLGGLTGFGRGYFDLDESHGYIKTATEVSSDNSALMRNIARHEHLLDASLASIGHALLHMGRTFGDVLPDESLIVCRFDDLIITDTVVEKAQDMAEVGVTMAVWE